MLRATLKSLRSRKLRLVLSGMAVVLGVMFVSAAMVLTTTLSASFSSVFSTVYADTDAQVRASAAVAGETPRERAGTLPAELLATVRTTSGVASATGIVQADGARVVGANGKVVTSSGPPRFGTNWRGESDLVVLRDGRGPQADDEIAVNASLATAAGISVGDRVGVLTLQPKKTFTLVGIFGYSGNRDTIGGEQTVAFTEPVAQQLMLGARGMYSSIDVKAAPGVSIDALDRSLRAELGDAYEVATGEQLRDEATAVAEARIALVNRVLLGFAGVALFVGAFLILNTFSILIAQRTRELALLRAIGASGGQVIGSVLVEAFVIGLLAAGTGLGAGIGVGWLLGQLFNRLGPQLPIDGVTVPASAVVSSLVVGTVVTMAAALVPALRAARIPPVAALQEAATPDRPLTRLTVAGAVLGAASAAAFGYGASDAAGDRSLYWIGGAVVTCFVGVALLTPLVARPVASLIGRAFAWSVPGRLGRLNSGRNPRRTAITAAALMVGLALITGVDVVLRSTDVSMQHAIEAGVKADLIVSGERGPGGAPSFDAAVLDRARQIPGVREVVGQYTETGMVDGARTQTNAVSDLAAAARVFGLRATAGSLEALATDQVAVDATRAAELGLGVGSTVQVQLPRGAARTMTVAGIYADNEVVRGWLLAADAVRNFRTPQPSVAFVQLADGADSAEVRRRLDQLVADSPEVTVADRTGYVDQQTQQLDTILLMIQILLALAILIAVLGIVNTLALSVLERTRELGLLRAIGLGRAPTMGMVTVEAVVISVFGGLLGVAVGSGLGSAVVGVLADAGVTELAFPWQRMALYLGLAAVGGVLAALLPAIRAARINVLAAIAHE